MTIYLHNALVLNSASSTAGTGNTSFTWSNIDLRMLLGDMYNKYDRFNLCLNTISQGLGGDNGNNFFATQADALVLIRISGLSFINNTYNIKSSGSNNTSFATLASFKFLNNTQQVQYLNGQNIITIGKNQDLANITIEYVRVSDLASVAFTANHPYPQMSFIFDVYGVEDFKINQVEQRIVK